MTNTVEPAATVKPSVTNTATATVSSTATATSTATETSTATATDGPRDTDTPTATTSPTATHTIAPTATRLPTETALPRPSDTPVPTATPLPTDTATEPAPTRILPVSDTPSPSPTSVQTPARGLPQLADDIAPTITSEADAIAQREFEPTLTALPTLDETEVAALLATPPPRPTQRATGTAAPTEQPADAAPRPATATTPLDALTPDAGLQFTPGPSDATSPADVGVRDLPPTATATLFQPTVEVRPEFLPPTIAPISFASTFSISSASVYQFNVGPGQVFTFQNIQLPFGVMLFKQNPIDENSWISTDQNGILRFRTLHDAQVREMVYSPFFHGFSSSIASIDQNKNRIVELDWSADGERFSFRVAPPPGTDTANAGVWFWQPRLDSQYDPTYPIIRDCPNEGYHSCSFVHASNARLWQTRAVSWRPIRGVNTVLLTVHLPDEGRNALAIAQAVREQTQHQASQAPHFIRYDYGHWNPNGQGIIVSGRRPDGRVIIGEVNSDLSGERVILDASALGLWLRDAVRRPNGQVVALGRPGAPGSGPLALYDGNGRQISGFIGDAAPEDLRWFPDRGAVVVSVHGRQHVVQVDGGSITDATDRLGDPQFSESRSGSSAIPSGVIQGSEYLPGQQLRTVIPILNIRQRPSTSSERIGQLVEGDYVAILAGPHQSGGYPWWKVQTVDVLEGWIAGVINDVPTIR